MTGYRPEFEAALRLFARVSEAMINQGYERPILVGGAAVELYSLSQLNTGDFDIVTGAQGVFEENLRQHGFTKPSGAGTATRGWVHPELKLGFEVVSATLLDGMADRGRVKLVDLDMDGKVAVIALEDIIADRMGQFASGSAPEMREQAALLFKLYDQADKDYMDDRIKYESGGDYGVSDFEN
ncbi:hypothetical protein [Alterisphingorhabdus coralli]|uniref:Uncharacterized protein n=1 Tax=Alterisphingorhabdus coralli TaxID=3071408 RepID=A0AA97F7X8_9SPHN|nr:hypothetical protein [Parasphingorhabdus sp. SCSIO 66989]WOE74932.1 hypothetical protein RB602_13995 [Parasphingorhabdus sp. SCSIO 66989]